MEKEQCRWSTLQASSSPSGSAEPRPLIIECVLGSIRDKRSLHYAGCYVVLCSAVLCCTPANVNITLATCIALHCVCMYVTAGLIAPLLDHSVAESESVFEHALASRC